MRFIIIDLRKEKLAQAVTSGIQEGYHSFHHKLVRGELRETCVSIATIVTLATLLNPSPAMAYEAGTIMKKAQPIIQVLKDASEPLAYGMYIWAFIKYMQGQRGEAKELLKAVTWGFIAIQCLPWFFDIVKGIGATPPS